MAERKVLNKYYPPDYDPSKIPRISKKNKQNDVRIMAPFNMKCNTCDNYIANATKFNAKKETIEDKTYNNLKIFRFYIKCPRCMTPIIFKTNPKEQGYEVEHGATEHFKAAKLAEKQAREEAEAEEEEEKINPMKHLENRTKASKQQMEASEHLQSLRALKYRHSRVDLDALIYSKRCEETHEPSETPIMIEDKPRQVPHKSELPHTSSIESLKIFHSKSNKPSPSSSLMKLKKIIKKPSKS